VIADYDKIKRIVGECPAIGIRFVELAGGDPLLWPELSKLMAYCRGLELFTLLPVSGEGMVKSFDVMGRDWLSIPDMIRISIHHDPNSGEDPFRQILREIETIKKYRADGKTQLGVILIPGEGGNLNREFLERVIALAEKLSCQIKPSPLLGTWLAENKEKFERLWADISDAECEALMWFAREPSVLPESILFRLEGGNNIDNPLCQAGNTVITVRNGRVLWPCAINPDLCVDIKNSLAAALSSKEELDCEEPGTRDHCKGCSYDCSDVRGTLSRADSTKLQGAYSSM